MIPARNRGYYFISLFFLLFNLSGFQLAGQKLSLTQAAVLAESSSSRQDTSLELRKRNAVTSEPDTNFTWEKYASFLTKISDTSKYIVLPLNEFRQTFDNNKIVIGLRHDVDLDLNTAYNFSETESNMGVRSSYFILHSAPYYLANPSNMGVHSQNIIPILKKMQDERKFEIGFHNDLVTLQLIYKLNSVIFLKNELDWLRQNGIRITGTAAHGSNYCKVYHYMNFYFFNECTFPVVPNREYNISVPIGGVNIPIMKGGLNDFGLEYEAYFLNNNKAFSDATITNGIRWDIGMLNLNQLQPGDRVIVLLHPEHWHKASILANIESFRFPGQLSSAVDAEKSQVYVEMPYGSKPDSLTANFILSPGAYAKVRSKLQKNGISKNNFADQVTYKVFAENRSVQKEWKVKVHVAENSECEFRSFLIPGITKAIRINTTQKMVLINVTGTAELSHVTPHFELSPGATAWISDEKQQTDAGNLDFTNPVRYKLVAENGVNSSIWTVIVQKEKNEANFISFIVPGFNRPAIIDTVNSSIFMKTGPEAILNNLNVGFELSAGARAWIGNNELLSDNNNLDFTNPVEVKIVSRDGLVIKSWTIDVFKEKDDSKGELPPPELLIYPNPTTGIFHLQIKNIKTSPAKVEIFNSLGEIVYMESLTIIGDFSKEINLTSLPSGVYILKYSGYEKPVRIVIQKSF